MEENPYKAPFETGAPAPKRPKKRPTKPLRVMWACTALGGAIAVFGAYGANLQSGIIAAFGGFVGGFIAFLFLDRPA